MCLTKHESPFRGTTKPIIHAHDELLWPHVVMQMTWHRYTSLYNNAAATN